MLTGYASLSWQAFYLFVYFFFLATSSNSLDEKPFKKKW